MVRVFKTNVDCHHNANLLLAQLSIIISDCDINFDLEDCDRILRLEGPNPPTKEVIQTLANNSFICFELE